MEFRLGINLGDVIEEKEGIYGDGVNIAARVNAKGTRSYHKKGRASLEALPFLF